MTMVLSFTYINIFLVIDTIIELTTNYFFNNNYKHLISDRLINKNDLCQHNLFLFALIACLT